MENHSFGLGHMILLIMVFEAHDFMVILFDGYGHMTFLVTFRLSFVVYLATLVFPCSID